MLHEYGIGVVNLGNNHIGNFGQDGIASTSAYLRAGDIEYFGKTGHDSERLGVSVAVNGFEVYFG